MRLFDVQTRVDVRRNSCSLCRTYERIQARVQCLLQYIRTGDSPFHGCSLVLKWNEEKFLMDSRVAVGTIGFRLYAHIYSQKAVERG